MKKFNFTVNQVCCNKEVKYNGMNLTKMFNDLFNKFNTKKCCN